MIKILSVSHLGSRCVVHLYIQSMMQPDTELLEVNLDNTGLSPGLSISVPDKVQS